LNDFDMDWVRGGHQDWVWVYDPPACAGVVSPHITYSQTTEKEKKHESINSNQAGWG
jgi:hypothetical protein